MWTIRSCPNIKRLDVPELERELNLLISTRNGEFSCFLSTVSIAVLGEEGKGP